MDLLYALATPVGVIPLFILAGGIALFVVVSLGGWGQRDLASGSKTFLSILATVFTLLGLLGVFLVVYPALRPSIVMVQSDLNIPTISTPMPTPIPTPLSPTDQFFYDAFGFGLGLISLIGIFGLAIGLIIGGIYVIRETITESSAIYRIYSRLPKDKNKR